MAREKRWRKRVRGNEGGKEGKSEKDQMRRGMEWNLMNGISHQCVAFILPPSSLFPGFAAVPDYPTAPWSDDGWSQWQWQVHSLACATEGSGEGGGS